MRNDRVICKTCYQFFHFMCIQYLCIYIYYISSIINIPSSLPRTRKLLIMKLHLTSLSFLVAIFAVLAYTQFINPNPNFFKYVINNHFTDLTFFSSPVISILLPYSMGGHRRHHHHQHKHPNKGRTGSFCCDDFPPDFPPETNTTSYICVDQNGCCNFTTVQAAVDAVPNISMKRTIIWINSGIYL